MPLYSQTQWLTRTLRCRHGLGKGPLAASLKVKSPASAQHEILITPTGREPPLSTVRTYVPLTACLQESATKSVNTPVNVPMPTTFDTVFHWYVFTRMIANMFLCSKAQPDTAIRVRTAGPCTKDCPLSTSLLLPMDAARLHQAPYYPRTFLDTKHQAAQPGQMVQEYLSIKNTALVHQCVYSANSSSYSIRAQTNKTSIDRFEGARQKHYYVYLHRS